MKIKLSAPQGSILAMTLVIVGLIGFTLASYLTLISAQNRSTFRSQSWNSAVPLIEAGIEEALAHLNKNGTTNLFVDGWTSESGVAVKRRNLGDGRYIAVIVPGAQPVVECSAYQPAPLLFSRNDGLMFAQAGHSQYSTSQRRKEVKRTVRVNTNGGALFAKGMVSKGSIDFNGNNVTSDSFDSADPNFSSNGIYDGTKRKDNGDVATNSSELDIFDAGNANIYGKVGTGPGGRVRVGANGSIGSMAWLNSGHTGIQAGYFSDDMNMSFPAISVPFSGGFAPSGGTVSLTNVTYGTTTVTTVTYPSPPPPGGVITNVGLVTSANYPDRAAFGIVVTNAVLVISPTLPSPLPVGTITTNTIAVTSTVHPGFSFGAVTTNSIATNTVFYPSPAPSGIITTNISACSVRYPFTPMPAGPPSLAPSFVPPSPGSYSGAITNRYVSTGTPANRGWYHDYAAISSFNYTIKIYTCNVPNNYSYYTKSYTYYTPQAYTYSTRSSTNITVTSTRFDYILDSYNYVLDDLSGSVYVRGDANLFVVNSIRMSGNNDGITIGSGGSLKLYMTGASTSIAGQGVVNRSGNAANFMYYGLDSNTSLDIRGNGAFCGVIYAPNAALGLRGGGSSSVEDFVGATITGSVRMLGHFNFHYDEDLARTGPRSRFMITSWNEIGNEGGTLTRLGISEAALPGVEHD
jgi:hypothetical protein